MTNTHLSCQETFPPHTAGLQLYPSSEGQLYQHTAAEAGRNTVIPERRVALSGEEEEKNACLADVLSQAWYNTSRFQRTSHLENYPGNASRGSYVAR